jgi:hypothetical protein
MRFMMLMIPRVYQGAEGRRLAAAFRASSEMVELMMKYNRQLEEATPSSRSTGYRLRRVPPASRFQAGRRRSPTDL